MMKFLSNIYWIIGALLVALLVRGFLISVYKIPTQSMAPTLLAGDFILASQIAYKTQFPWSSTIYFKQAPVRNDLVIFQFSPKKAVVKSMAQYLRRIVAVPGDEIEIKEGQIILNGRPCSYDPVTDENIQASVFIETCRQDSRRVLLTPGPDGAPLKSFPKQTVPAGEFYILGDNRSMTDDSRDLGTIETDQIASKVSFIWLSYGSTQDFISGPKQIRWNRILTKPR
jgi:signal peptidase I